jgi:hypothetical protein
MLQLVLEPAHESSMPGDRGNQDSALKTHPTGPDITNMDLTDTITDGVPTLPTLPTLPELPSTPTVDVAVAAPMSLPPLRPSPAANASYGIMPSKPRAGEPSPAALQAAEQRRRAKKRRRIRRIAMLVVAIAIAVLAGPPLARWIADNVDSAGSTETESPAPSDDTD